MTSEPRSTWVDHVTSQGAPKRTKEKGISVLTRRHLHEDDSVPTDLQEWLEEFFPSAFSKPFGPHHEDLIEWAAQIRMGMHPRPFIGIWPRGGGKSTLIECVVIALGAPRPLPQVVNGEEQLVRQSARGYTLYVSETQEQADKHVEDIQTRLESQRLRSSYPQFAAPKIRRLGHTASWSRNRLITGTGYVVDALGLNSAARGVKLEDKRPDMLVFDDIDDKHDRRKISDKKETIIKDSIIPTFGGDAAIVGIQNKIIPDGVFARLADERADYLMRRIVSGPLKAVRDLETEKQFHPDLGEDGRYIDTIVEGEPTWEGQDLEACQRRIEESGLASFLRECQHEVEDVEGALWTREQLESIRVNTHPTLTRILIGVDPSGGTAETGIIAGGLGRDRKGYILEDGSMGGEDPNAWGRKIVSLFHKWEADAVVAEKNYGGSMVRSTILSATGENVQVPVYLVPSTSRKYTRAEPVAAAYGSKDVDWQDTKVHHVGTFSDLEHQQRTFVPGNESPDRLDALVHLLRKLVVNLGRSDSGSTLPNTQSR